MESVCIHRVYALSELNLAKKCKGITSPGTEQTVRKQEVPMLWFNFILGSNYIFFCFKLIIIHYHTPKQREIKFEPRIKLNHNTHIKLVSPKLGWTVVIMQWF